MRVIDINHVMNQLGIQPIQWQELQAQQAQQDEVKSTSVVDTSIGTSHGSVDRIIVS
ncbi:MAG: hypothetical protein K0Q73_9221 [Paenibacillus sp.]|nr:hypothetical protein [Paenibacillus sp.]